MELRSTFTSGKRADRSFHKMPMAHLMMDWEVLLPKWLRRKPKEMKKRTWKDKKIVNRPSPSLKPTPNPPPSPTPRPPPAPGLRLLHFPCLLGHPQKQHDQNQAPSVNWGQLLGHHGSNMGRCQNSRCPIYGRDIIGYTAIRRL